MTEQQGRKQVLRTFMRDNYTDERLAMLLAHAQDGKLLYKSCCCFIGASNANHALSDESGYGAQHYRDARKLPEAKVAEAAYNELRSASPSEDWDKVRRRILIPMIRAEMKRRSLVARQTEGRDPVCTKPAKVAV